MHIDTADIVWDTGTIALAIRCEDGAAPSIVAARADGVDLRMPPGLPLVDVVTVGAGRTPAGGLLVHSTLGAALRYRSHAAGPDGLVVELTDDDGAAAVTVRFDAVPGAPAFRATVRVGAGARPLVLRSVTTFSSRLGSTALGGDGGREAAWTLLSATSEWTAEGRWRAQTVEGGLLPDLAVTANGVDARGTHRIVSTGTWSTGRALPTAALTSAAGAWLWQIEHNGPWRVDVGQDAPDRWFALAGPTDDDHGWVRALAPGEAFTTVPATVALARDLDGAVAAMTAARRLGRRPHPDADAMPVVFNDYMNTLIGDPSTAALEPLIDAAAEVGAQIFCIDAGWYADGPWWDTVGEWRPAVHRFPGGLDRVLDRIRDRGMVAGLWVEPEVIGVESPVADRLPAEAFLMRHGQRIVEHGRYHLDLRHPAAVAHLDGTIDRLVEEHGIGYCKFDYNIDPGAGTDRDADSPGDGLLGHARALQAWLDRLLDRHPALVIENCGSGAMRSDAAMLSRSQLQSTSDQEDPLRYPPIAASAPMQMPPEQAANWAYPQPGMTAERAAFCLATGMLGRYYLSGHLDGMSSSERALVADAVALAKSLRPEIRAGIPVWPLGLPDWDADVVALGLDAGESVLLTVWDRVGGSTIELPLPGVSRVTTLFPVALPSWEPTVAAAGRLLLRNPADEPAARVFRIER